MAEQGEHKKEHSGETVDSRVSGISGVSMGFLFLSSDEEYKPSRNLEDSGFPPIRQTFPISQDDPIVGIWNSSLRHKVIELIKPNTNWCALDVIRRGYGLRSEDNPIVILVTVMKGASVPEWRRLVLEMKKCCVNEQCPHILVQAQEGKAFRGAWVSRPYDQRPLIGSSVGIVGDSITGTLGGYFELRKEGQQPIRVGVTCHHVVIPGSVGLSRVIPNSNSTIGICQPSASDYEENEDNAISDLKQHENEIQDIQGRAREGFADSAEFRWLPDKEALLTAEKALLSTSETFNTHLGYAFASSGFHRKQKEPAEDGCCLDWALIKVDQARLGNNKFPEGIFPQFSRPAPPYIIKTRVMDVGDQAVKWGRSTGYTTGTFNSIKSYVILPDSDGLSTEWCFIGRDGRDFGNLGDSGSFVVSKYGELGGIIIGGSERGPGGFTLTYVTPITEVFDDIEKQLGYSVHLPEV